MSGRREVRLLPRLLRDPLARHAGSDPAARRFDSVSRDRNEPTVFGYPTVNREDAGSNPAGRKPVVQRQNLQPERTNMFVAIRGGCRYGALSCKQRVAGLTPALSTTHHGGVAQMEEQSRRRCLVSHRDCETEG